MSLVNWNRAIYLSTQCQFWFWKKSHPGPNLVNTVVGQFIEFLVLNLVNGRHLDFYSFLESGIVYCYITMTVDLFMSQTYKPMCYHGNSGKNSQDQVSPTRPLLVLFLKNHIYWNESSVLNRKYQSKKKKERVKDVDLCYYVNTIFEHIFFRWKDWSSSISMLVVSLNWS